MPGMDGYEVAQENPPGRAKRETDVDYRDDPRPSEARGVAKGRAPASRYTSSIRVNRNGSRSCFLRASLCRLAAI